MARKKSPLIYMIALLLFCGGVGYVAFSSLAGNKVYFINVSEALGMPLEELRTARLFGTVAEGYTRDESGLGVRFQLRDADAPGQLVWVNYRGVVPDTFEPGAEVIVEGGMAQAGSAGAEAEFDAKTLMTKCPSKYEKGNRERG